MTEWNETCSQAPSNRPISDKKLAEIKDKMQFIDPDTGRDTRMKSAAEDFPFQYGDPSDRPQTACAAQMAGENRERRERPRMSDIERSVNKYFDGVKIMGTDKPCTYGSETAPPMYDKNTPGSLKQLRWAIYEQIDFFQADYSRVTALCLKQEVERLFKEYTHS